jgi:glycosyltransferase involved in cell wall biosynthesis
MHVAFNAYFWNRPETGSGQYLRQLVYHLNRLVSDLEITLIYPRIDGAAPAAEVPPDVAVHDVPLRAGNWGKLLFEQRDFPRACETVDVDLAHVPYWGSPLRAPIPVVVTVHDLTTMLIREYRRSVTSRLYNGLVGAAARGAARVITDSGASKADIVKHLGIPAEKVTPIYLGVGRHFGSEPNLLMDMAVVQKYDLPEEFVLYLGGYALHKNVTTLLYAYTYVATALGPDYPLVLAGRKPEQVSAAFPDYDDYIGRLGLEENVRWIGFVDEEDKPALYRSANSMVFPSRYEGFGLPPLEAMACGTPVVTTNSASLPEIVGDAAFTVDPEDARGMAGAIISSVIQEELAAEMSQKGLQQAARFSWDDTATQTVIVYDEVVNRSEGEAG